MYRLQFELTERGKEDFSNLKRIFDLRTNKELLNNALTFLSWAAAQIHSGRIIASVDEKSEKYRELSMPIFDSVRIGSIGRMRNARHKSIKPERMDYLEKGAALGKPKEAPMPEER